jgi:hypothetical protein
VVAGDPHDGAAEAVGNGFNEFTQAAIGRLFAEFGEIARNDERVGARRGGILRNGALDRVEHRDGATLGVVRAAEQRSVRQHVQIAQVHQQPLSGLVLPESIGRAGGVGVHPTTLWRRSRLAWTG